MINKIKVAAVSYLNTKPFLYGIDHSPVKNMIQLTVEHPSRIATQLLSGEIDLGLVPVAVIPQMRESHIVSNYGICCDGEVASVVICSQMPLKESEKLFLDHQSRTSVALTQILLKEYWHAMPRLVPASPGYEKQVMGKYAGLFIGDRALKLKEMYDYVYDLGEAWKRFSGLPFVFARWVSNKVLDENFVGQFNEALKYGATHIDQVAAAQLSFFPGVDVQDYLKNRIHYVIDDQKKKGMEYFLQLLGKNANG